MIFDTEYTAWEGCNKRGWTRPNEHREIVQIGAVLVGPDLAELDSFKCLVKPTKNPKLSQYFTDLTRITQAAVDTKGFAYPDALTCYASWAGGLQMYCWGMDLEIMAYNAKLVGAPFPFPIEQKRDIRSVFELAGIATLAYMSSTIPRAFGEEPPPTAHDALSDARSILQGLRAFRRRSA
ncbi:MAG TPA: 3'-5' exonuclease [Candidatus Paceibacterota bacterium]